MENIQSKIDLRKEAVDKAGKDYNTHRLIEIVDENGKNSEKNEC